MKRRESDSARLGSRLQVGKSLSDKSTHAMRLRSIVTALGDKQPFWSRISVDLTNPLHSEHKRNGEHIHGPGPHAPICREVQSYEYLSIQHLSSIFLPLQLHDVAWVWDKWCIAVTMSFNITWCGELIVIQSYSISSSCNMFELLQSVVWMFILWGNGHVLVYGSEDVRWIEHPGDQIEQTSLMTTPQEVCWSVTTVKLLAQHWSILMCCILLQPNISDVLLNLFLQPAFFSTCHIRWI